jgi:hypothetical protein
MPDRHCAYIYTQHLGNCLSRFGIGGVVHCAPRTTDSAPTATAFPPVTHTGAGRNLILTGREQGKWAGKG